MKKNQIHFIDEKIKYQFLPFVQRPSRYIGGEINQVKKNLENCKLTMALCFPDIYEIAESHTGLSTLYQIINGQENIAAQRCYAPWTDAEKIMRNKKIPLFTLESRAAVQTLDIMAFSMTTELCCTNVLNMIDLANMEVYSRKRTENDPLIMAGGQMANCAEPMAEFIDFFFLGQAEDKIVEVINFIADHKNNQSPKDTLLKLLAKRFDFIYVPALYQPKFQNGKFHQIIPIEKNLNRKINDAQVKDFDETFNAVKPIVPFAQAVHERVSIEIMRGCPGRCRFCQASFCRRPIKYRTPEKILELAKKTYKNTGHDTISLLSLSSADYPQLEKLVEKLQHCFNDKHVGLSLPSLKVQTQLQILPKLVKNVRKAGLTIAVEAASQKLREIINKPITNEDLFAAVKAAYQQGFVKIKLYFMVGFPGETDEDIIAIADLCCELAKLRKQVDNRTANINAAVSWLVPKPHTPFAFIPQKSAEYFARAKEMIINRKHQLKAKFINFKFHRIEQSVLESALARADRTYAKVIYSAWKDGAKFDLWTEHFDFDKWKNAFAKESMDIDSLAARHFTADQTCPWDHLGGPDKKQIISHFQQAVSKADHNE